MKITLLYQRKLIFKIDLLKLAYLRSLKTVFFLFIFSLLSISTLFAQSEGVSLDFSDAKVKQVLKEIEKQTDYHFIYSKSLVDVERTISLKLDNSSIEEAISKVFESTSIEFKISDNQIVLSPSNVLNPVTEQIEEVKPGVINGSVKDEYGLPLPGVNVFELGSGKGTITDPFGNYSIETTNEDPVLKFSFIGFLPQEISVKGESNVNVVLQEDIKELEEVVVIGYGTSKKSDLTGSVISVSKERLGNLPSTSILQSMQGAVAGVTISQGNAKPGAEPEIYIRGLNSISASNKPLIVVDGVPDASMSNINQNDIQSIEILKDASASAIYGARGSNGVILITTKRGSGKPKVEFNYYFGKQKISNYLNLMDGETHLKMKLQAYEMGGAPADTADVYSVEEYNNFKNGRETNWQDVYLREATIKEYQVGVSAGNENTNYYLSFSYGDHDHIMQNFNYKTIGLRFNIDQKIGEWLSVGNSLNLTSTRESGVSGNLKYANVMSPWMNPYEEDGTLDFFPANNNFIGNPLAEQNILVKDRRHQIFNNAFAIVKFPIDGMTYRLNVGVDVRNVKNNRYEGRDTPLGSVRNGIAELNSSLTNNWVIENIFNYEKEFLEKHSVKFTGLYSLQEYNKESFGVNAEGFPNDGVLYNDLLAATIFQNPKSSASRSSVMSYMARLTYDFDNRYLLTLTARKDGYSGFGDGRKFGTFPSAALAWKIKNEEFMKPYQIFSDLKFRVSYGKNGNQAVQPYASISNLTTGMPYIMNDQIVYGYFLEKMENSLLGWESTSSFNTAIDFGILRQRISGSIEYYNTNTNELLLERAVSGITGFTSIFANIGKTHNSGFEFTINTVNVQKGLNGFKWSTNLNFSFNKNEIVDLYGDTQDDIANSWFIGEPISVIFDYVFDGIVKKDEDMAGTPQPTAKPGEIKVKDVSGNGTIDPEDRQIIGYGIPDFLAGITNTFNYKGFDLSIFVHGVHGITKQNSILGNAGSPGNNQLDIDWWTSDNQSEIYPAIAVGNSTSYYSSFQYESADFIRIKDISLGYTLPENISNKIGVDRLRVYVNGRNLYTFTKWQGLDPETGSSNNPNIMSVIFGLNLTL